MSALEAGEIQPMAKVGLVKAWAPILRIEWEPDNMECQEAQFIIQY
jgi:hypothetical protein